MWLSFPWGKLSWDREEDGKCYLIGDSKGEGEEEVLEQATYGLFLRLPMRALCPCFLGTFV